ncbi:flagellar protein FlaG [Shewanella xiamenensis]|uniref:flagellar protein FlaG n=1 Tax=Shewanella xiamenensis TaxID=332186 RepID=UPI00068AD554|nr:flagellar protein FlaG [Shewanella xiamenensis]MCR4535111.1 flagellar protein FlaG [Shewanella xiamenensis]MDI5836462.1 flagellar protein FlaG [Shewanella xiamenensis]MDI5840807.1 flagellar protein FlaG [Shewanella xiamenensis]MDI5844702.1 flagellar protein FlaG [Shewanella xiamenensis]MDI5848765.1 flagellar protein FlaG [Shewanella xiamenensis]
MSDVTLNAGLGLQSVVNAATKSAIPLQQIVVDAATNVKNGVNFALNSDVVNSLADTANVDQQQEEQTSLTQVASSLTETMSMMKKGLEFKVDELEGLPVVSVIDVNSGELIRQIPSEEALALAEKMSEIAGVLMKTEA